MFYEIFIRIDVSYVYSMLPTSLMTTIQLKRQSPYRWQPSRSP